MPRLLAIGHVSDEMRLRLGERFAVDVLPDGDDRAAWLREEGPAVDAILTNGNLGVPEDVALACPNLKVVSSNGVGYDSIDAKGLAARGVLVAHTPGVLNDEVADTFVALWLAVSRRIVAADRHARSGAWERGGFPLTRSVQGRRVGILGLGRIGQEIANRVKCFRGEVHYHSRTPKAGGHAYHESPKALAAAVEVLVCVTPGGAETRHLVDMEVLKALGPEGILVNVARGSVVDEAALVEALEQGLIAGAGLDVFAMEPHIPDALKAMENVVLLPHVASATVETRAAMADLTARNLLQWLEDGRVVTPVPECRGLVSG
jgi:lactate dehydrogenase-like 2-hydroxyacid dehydrogenase